ncbi:MAG: hypothetical protein JO020_24190 [Chloroflexi bacterium]|nr:hypothetical protein [Chloroflexota bacterium]
MNLQAWARWQAAAGPWRGWAICPALSMPAARTATVQTAADVVDQAAALRTATAQTAGDRVDLAEVLRPGNTALLLDLDPLVGVRSAAQVSRQGLAHVVLVLPRWPHLDGVLPTPDLTGLLVATARDLRQPKNAANVVFVLDGHRQKLIRRSINDPRVDNRYALLAADLPNLRTLRDRDITRVVKVTSTR